MIKNIFSKLALSSLLILSFINIVYAFQTAPDGPICTENCVSASVPEPGMWALFLIGGIAFALNKWKRK